MGVLLHLNPTSGTPLYRQLANSLQQAIAAGDFKPGDRLPSVRELARTAGVNMLTAAKALQSLETEGLTETRRGVGVFVSVRAVEESLERKQELLKDSASQVAAQAVNFGLTEGQTLFVVLNEYRRFQNERTRPTN